VNADHHRDLGIALAEDRILDEAVDELLEALRLQPANADTRCWLGIALGRKGLWKEAIAAFSETLDKQREVAKYWSHRAEAYAETGHWKEATADFAKAIDLKKDDPFYRYRQALACLQAGDVSHYRKLCAEMVEQFGPVAKADSAHWVVWTCALSADAVADWTLPLQLAEKAVADNPKNYRALHDYGAVLYRAGQSKEALRRLTEAVLAYKNHEKSLSDIASDWSFLAMAHNRLGNAEEAKKWHDQAVQSIDLETRKQPSEPATANRGSYPSPQ
jgi:tetratricopeptide (TPR) repeat protein